MASSKTWLDLLAWTKALFEATKATVDVVALYKKYSSDPETLNEAQRVSIQFSTFSEEEVTALSTRMSKCQTQFAVEGDPDQRVRCICSVLNTAKKANGDILPNIDDWKNIHSQLKCAKHIATK
jgi:hypothetical protein